MDISSEELKKRIVNVQHHRFKGAGVMVCCLTLDNGYYIVSTTSSSIDQFNEATARRLSYNNAFNELKIRYLFLEAEDKFRKSNQHISNNIQVMVKQKKTFTKD